MKFKTISNMYVTIIYTRVLEIYLISKGVFQRLTSKIPRIVLLLGVLGSFSLELSKSEKSKLLTRLNKASWSSSTGRTGPALLVLADVLLFCLCCMRAFRRSVPALKVATLSFMTAGRPCPAGHKRWSFTLFKISTDTCSTFLILRFWLLEFFLFKSLLNVFIIPIGLQVLI